MLAAFQRTLNPLETRDDAGSGDGLEETGLHRQEVELPGGGQLVLSDLEELTPERIAQASRMVAEILEQGSSKDHQS
jgi:hypothetical protein